MAIPLHSFGAVTGMQSSSWYSQAAGPGTDGAGASGGNSRTQSEAVLRALSEIPEFDAAFYADTYPDVTEVFERDPGRLKEHYLSFGIFEGRMANRNDLIAWRLRIMRRIRRFLDFTHHDQGRCIQ